MKSEMIRNMIATIYSRDCKFTEEEVDFVLLFALRTGDGEKAIKLLDELQEVTGEADAQSVIEKYRKMMEEKAPWIQAIEEFYLVTEQLHFEEKAALRRLQSILKENGISIEGEEVK